MISLDTTSAQAFTDSTKLETNTKKAFTTLERLLNGTGKGNDFLGWVNLPSSINDDLIQTIKDSVERVKQHSQVLIIIGIGGSYLGSKAVISALNSKHYNKTANANGWPEIYFSGTDISSIEMQDLIEALDDRDFSINIISKSGTTTEPAIAFRVLKKVMEEKYGVNNYNHRIIATTDSSKGALRSLVNQNKCESYVIPDDVGGRFSVFTPVGLFPIAAAGIDITELINGAKSAQGDLIQIDENNIAIRYAAMRNTLYEEGKSIEILSNFEPRLSLIAAWWKQLFGESEGKEGKGIFPASADFTCDLHSLGQYIQDGPRHLLQTVLQIKNKDISISIPENADNLDNLNYLAGKSMNYVNEMALKGTLEAHHEGGIPNVIIEISKLDAFHIGYLLYFFEISCGISAYMLDVNPFDQPGVEAYKKKMFSLLGKP